MESEEQRETHFGRFPSLVLICPRDYLVPHFPPAGLLQVQDVWDGDALFEPGLLWELVPALRAGPPPRAQVVLHAFPAEGVSAGQSDRLHEQL